MSEPRRANRRMPPSQLPVDVEFNIGTDVESCDRFEHLGEQANARLLRMFDECEIEYCRRFDDAAERFAGTWCAKEAVVKAAWPWAHLDPRRVVIGHTDDGSPLVLIDGWDAESAGVSIRVSVSHAGGMAVANAIAWRAGAGAR